MKNYNCPNLYINKIFGGNVMITKAELTNDGFIIKTDSISRNIVKERNIFDAVQEDIRFIKNEFISMVNVDYELERLTYMDFDSDINGLTIETSVENKFFKKDGKYYIPKNMNTEACFSEAFIELFPELEKPLKSVSKNSIIMIEFLDVNENVLYNLKIKLYELY